MSRDEELHAEFLIVGETQITAAGQFIRANWRQFKERNEPLRVIVTSKTPDRLDTQIAYYFGVLLKSISDQAFVGGKKHDKIIWDRHYRLKYLPYETTANPITGEEFIVTAELKRGKIGVKRMTQYLQEVEADAVSELGIMLPAKPAL